MKKVKMLESISSKILLWNSVANFLDDTTGDFCDIYRVEAFSCNFAEIYHNIWPYRGLTRNTRIRILLEAGVEDGIGNLVGHFIRMSVRNRLRRKNVAMLFGIHSHSL